MTAERSPSNEIALFLADVDGTLMTDAKKLTRRTCDAVQRLGAAGIAFTVTSSRPPRGLEMLIEPLRLTLPAGGFNGGTMFDVTDFAVIEQLVLSRAAAECAIEIILNHGLDVWCFTCDEWYVRDKSAPHVDQERETLQFAPTVVDGFDDLLDRAVKIVGVSDDTDRMKKAERAVQRALDGMASAIRSQAYYLDVTHSDARKGTVVRCLARHLSIPERQIATIGDMPNDVDMFARSGLSIAMGNADKEVQEQADFVTESNENDGFPTAVDRIILGRAASSTQRRA